MMLMQIGNVKSHAKADSSNVRALSQGKSDLTVSEQVFPHKCTYHAWQFPHCQMYRHMGPNKCNACMLTPAAWNPWSAPQTLPIQHTGDKMGRNHQLRCGLLVLIHVLRI